MSEGEESARGYFWVLVGSFLLMDCGFFLGGGNRGGPGDESKRTGGLHGCMRLSWKRDCISWMYS
eukprot:6194989-Pleurochrysis_carterae.AAC.2